jgi:hypothetical protein
MLALKPSRGSLLLFLMGYTCLLLSQQCSASTLPCTALQHRDQLLSCLNDAQNERLDALLFDLISDPSNLGPYATVQGYLQERPSYAAEAVLTYSRLQTSINPPEAALDSFQLAVNQATTADTPPASTLPEHSHKHRHLLELSGTFSDLEVSDGQLNGFTRRDTRITAPDSSFQAVSKDFSSFSTPLTRELQDKLAHLVPSLADASSTFLGSDQPPPPPAAAAAGGVSSNDRAAAAAAAAPAVTAMGGGQQQVQPSLRIVGGVEAPTDR